MADIIQLLPDAIANQIAAGEVIQRPASVVKELMENSIDAESSKIKLILKDAGKLLIQVIDDGKGMSETDARMSFERHATSKIKKAEDLFVINTKGFRGEALASIAAIAQIELKTKKESQELATRILIEGSTIKKQELCQHPKGTSIAVKNLFYNVPARRKFLKTNAVELKHIMDEFQRLALAHPDIFFSLFHNENEVYHLPKENLRQRIVNIFGKNTNEKLVPVEESTDIIKISGFVGKPEFHRKTRGDQYLFVNNRFIKSPYLNHAIMAAYEDLLPKGTYPFYCIFIEIDPAQIDVNVHPTKQEIKFEEERLVYNYVRVATRHALGQYTMVPTLDFENNNNFVGPPSADFNKINRFNAQEEANLANWKKLFDGVEEIEENGPVNVVSSLVENESSSDHKDPQQFHNTYILSQIKSGILIIDQQSAHERILFEKHLEMLKEQKAMTQKALFPKTIEFSNADALLFQ
ncbi:MAG: DNA mismatch repair endonuclease MutL, partial [Bacteroidota bacterium]